MSGPAGRAPRRLYLADATERPKGTFRVFGWALGAMALAMVYRGAAILVLVLMPPVLCGGWDLGWRVTEAGLQQVWWLRRARTVPWRRIQAVRWAGDHADLILDDGTITLDRRWQGWAELAATVEQRLAHLPEASAPDIDLPPEQVAEWLGLAPGEVLVCRRKLPIGVMAFVTLLTLAAMAAAATMRPPERLVFLAISSLMLLIVPAIAQETRRLELRAGPWGLDVRRDKCWRRVAWGSLWSLESRGARCWVETRDGPVSLPVDLTNRDRLVVAIRKAIAAREAGQRLPRSTIDVPDAALSRAEAQVDAGRGLSLGDSRPGV
jgi:hypothetical protein